MSRKWEQAKKRDAEIYPAWAAPIRWTIHALSTVTLAIILLTFVAIYATLASVPIGLLAQIPTYAIIALTLLIPLALVFATVRLISRRALGDLARAPRFLIQFFSVLLISVGVVIAWRQFAWPALRWDPAHDAGLMLFADIVQKHESTTLRRLPAFEMTELEFYSWWPLRIVLLLFVLNLIVATVRRIEFKFVNIGVLSVHTGIVLIALGSVFYSRNKLEGDVLLPAGQVSQSGVPSPGPAIDAFYDNTDVALWLDQYGLREQRPLTGVPRYNDYLALEYGETARQAVGQTDVTSNDATLDIRVPDSRANPPRIDPELKFRIVGYAGHARENPQPDWVRIDPAEITAVRPGDALNPVRFITLQRTRAAEGQTFEGIPFFMLPNVPSHRGFGIQRPEVRFTIDYTKDSSDQRWRDLATELPEGVFNALIVEVPGAVQSTAEGPTPGLAEAQNQSQTFRKVFPISSAGSFKVADGATDTGYTIEVTDIRPTPPFPIITPAYEGADSSLAIIKITTPTGETYDRWVYHKFPEISQDLLPTNQPDGRPTRRNADPAIKVTYIDASQILVHMDEQRDETGDITVRAIVRRPGESAVATYEGLTRGDQFDMLDGLAVRLGERWTHAERIERPAIIPEEERNRDDIGTHRAAMIAVEITAEGKDWKRIAWIPFVQYTMIQPWPDPVDLPDGRQISMAFGRVMHRFPGFSVKLIDFEIQQYDHRGAPRDFQSVLQVQPDEGEPYVHKASLNAPLTAPFHWSEDRAVLANVTGRLTSGLDPRQFKLAQSGWDAQGWQERQEMVDRGMLERPYAAFTILGVGNNPGIHVIAFGSVLMAVGIPWAFYIKPALVRRQKNRLKAQFAGEAGDKKATKASTSTVTSPPRKQSQQAVGAES